MTNAHADNIAMTKWIDEYAINRYALDQTNNSSPDTTSPKFIDRNTKEVKGFSGIYMGTQNSPNQSLSKDSVALQSKDSVLVDSYFGIRRDFSLFSYNLGVKSYNAERKYLARNWTQLNVDEFYAGVRINQLGVGLAQNHIASHSRVSYFQKIYSVAMQFDVGSTTILETGDKYYEWKLNAMKQYDDIRVAFSVNKNFTPSQSLPVEAYIEIARALNIKHF